MQWSLKAHFHLLCPIMLSNDQVCCWKYTCKSHWYYCGDATKINIDVNLIGLAPADSLSGNAISSMGISAPPPAENTPVPASQPPPRVFQERIHVRVNTLPKFNSVSTLCFLTFSPYACGRHFLWAELEMCLTVYQVVTPKHHRDCSREFSLAAHSTYTVNSDYFSPPPATTPPFFLVED